MVTAALKSSTEPGLQACIFIENSMKTRGQICPFASFALTLYQVPESGTKTNYYVTTIFPFHTSLLDSCV